MHGVGAKRSYPSRGWCPPLSGLRLAGQLTGLAGFLVFVTGFIIGVIQPTPACPPPRGLLCQAEGVERALVMTLALWGIGLAMVVAAVAMLFVVTKRGDAAREAAPPARKASAGSPATSPAAPDAAGVQGPAPSDTIRTPEPSKRPGGGPSRQDARSGPPHAPAGRPVQAGAPGGLRKRERAAKGRRR